ncbi:MAG: carboxylating nicotinate-nucleotide diphosphorylase [Bacteroidales bacterium]
MIQAGSELEKFILNAIQEDIGEGDHSSMACIPADASGKAKLLVKQEGILAGSDIARQVFQLIDPNTSLESFIEDGAKIKTGDVVFHVSGLIQSILKSERLVLNIMQRMSGIATRTRAYVDKIADLPTKILDTRKTTPGMRFLEKAAVRTGGGENHRMGLYDMIMLKDNHIDFAGGIRQAIQKTKEYIKHNNLKIKVEIEARNLKDIRDIMETGEVDVILLDNFTPETTKKAVEMINGRYLTESSGGITLDNIREYALCKVDFISVGALTHQISSLDLSLKAIDY